MLIEAYRENGSGKSRPFSLEVVRTPSRIGQGHLTHTTSAHVVRVNDPSQLTHRKD